MFSITNTYLFYLLFFCLGLTACQTPSPSAAKKKSKASRKSQGLLHYERKTGSLSHKKPNTPDPVTQAKQLAASNLRRQQFQGFKDNCHVLVKRYAPYFRDLITSLPPHLQEAHDMRLSPITTMSEDHCQDDQLLRPTLAQLREVALTAKPCVGFILPTSGSGQKTTENIVRGLRAAFSDLQNSEGLPYASFEEAFKIRDSAGSTNRVKSLFAELILIDQCALVAGGIETAESQQLIPLAQGIQSPLLILSSRAAIPAEAPSIFGLFPSESRLAHALVKGSQSRSIQKIAIMRPSHGRADRLIDFFKQEFTSNGGIIVDEVSYSPSQFDAMQTAARRLFRTDIIGREAEYHEAIKQAQKKAEETGTKFNPKMVLLPPQVGFDALLIPDDFRSVRHMVKLIKYHMVPKLTLIGNHEWRSQGLLSPREPFLEGSFFVDFVPRYDQIPQSIPVTFDGSPYFAQPQEAAKIDFQLIGYHLGRVILGALQEAPQNRLTLINHLSNLKIRDLLTGQPLPVFDHRRMALWPTFGYQIEQGGIQSLEVMMTELMSRRRGQTVYSFKR